MGFNGVPSFKINRYLIRKVLPLGRSIRRVVAGSVSGSLGQIPGELSNGEVRFSCHADASTVCLLRRVLPKLTFLCERLEISFAIGFTERAAAANSVFWGV